MRVSLSAPVHTSESPLPALEKPGEHAHVVDPAALVLPAGQAVQLLAPALLYVLIPQTALRAQPAASGLSLVNAGVGARARVWAREGHALEQTSELPVPAPAYPATQLHVAELAALVLKLGQGEHAAAWTALNDPAGQTVCVDAS